MIKSKFLVVIGVLLTLFCGCEAEEGTSEVVKIEIKTPPSKIDYYQDEFIRYSDLVLLVEYGNGDTISVSLNEFDSFGIIASPEEWSPATEDTKRVTFTHEESGNTVIQLLYYLTFSDIDENTFRAVRINHQIWMQENLKVTRFQNGDKIPTTVPADKDIHPLEKDPLYQWAYNGEEQNVEEFGRLYTHYVAMDPRNVCPSGWHVPTYNDVSIMQKYLKDNRYNYIYGKNTMAYSLASKDGWNQSNEFGHPGREPETNNATGFTAKASGWRKFDFGEDQAYVGFGETARWWVDGLKERDDYYDIGYSMRIGGNYEAGKFQLDNYSANRKLGYSIRCIKDYNY